MKINKKIEVDNKFYCCSETSDKDYVRCINMD